MENTIDETLLDLIERLETALKNGNKRDCLAIYDEIQECSYDFAEALPSLAERYDKVIDDVNDFLY